MVRMLDISNRADIFKRLNLLKADARPLFGKMSAQHMVEHLAFITMISSEKHPHKLYYATEKADKIKAYTIYSEKEIMVGFKAPMLPDDPVPMRHMNLEAAITELKKELKAFDDFFSGHPDARPTNPTMGPLNYAEWIIFHNKHFTHHFKQFDLL